MILRDEVILAIQAHAMWKINLLKVIESGASDLDPAEVFKEDVCAFGKWLIGDTIPDEAKVMDEYKTCVRLHREFHERTGGILELALHGKRADALAALAEGSIYHELSATLTQHLRLWSAKWENMRSGK